MLLDHWELVAAEETGGSIVTFKRSLNTTSGCVWFITGASAVVLRVKNLECDIPEGCQKPPRPTRVVKKLFNYSI